MAKLTLDEALKAIEGDELRGMIEKLTQEGLDGFELPQNQLEIITKAIKAEVDKKDKGSPEITGAVYLAVFGLPEDKSKGVLAVDSALDKLAKEAGADDAAKQKIGAAIVAAAKAATEAKKKAPAVTLSLDEARDAISNFLIEQKVDDVKTENFEKGFDTLTASLSEEEEKAIAVPEDKIKVVANAVYAAATSIPDDKQTNVTKHQDALGFIGLNGVVEAGIADAKVKGDAHKKVGEAFTANFTEEADKKLANEFVAKKQKETAKKIANAGPPTIYSKVASVGVGVVIAAWFAKQFGSKEVTNENGEVEQKPKSSIWKKALLGILFVASAAFAYKTVGQNKSVGAALDEMKNPLTWVQKVAASKELGAVVGNVKS